MAITQADVNLMYSITESGTRDNGSKLDKHNLSLKFPFSDGTGDDAIKKVWSDNVTGVGTGGTTYDLAGSLTDVDGSAITFTTIKLIFLRASASNAGNVIIGNNAANDFAPMFGAATHTLIVPPGGVAVLLAPDTGYTVTAGTGDILKIAASTGTVEYDLAFAGITA